MKFCFTWKDKESHKIAFWSMKSIWKICLMLVLQQSYIIRLTELYIVFLANQAVEIGILNSKLKCFKSQ